MQMVSCSSIWFGGGGVEMLVNKSERHFWKWGIKKKAVITGIIGGNQSIIMRCLISE